jgi:hypothetical protein
MKLSLTAYLERHHTARTLYPTTETRDLQTNNKISVRKTKKTFTASIGQKDVTKH